MAEGKGETGERKRGEEGGDLPQPDVPAGTGVTRRLDKLGVELSAEQYVPRDQREKHWACTPGYIPGQPKRSKLRLRKHPAWLARR